MAARHRMVLPLRETVAPDLTYPKRRVSCFSFNKESLMSRIFAVLLMTAGILHAEGPSDSSVPNSV